ncbi:phenylalanine--tRNA ligase subunit beta [Rhizosphaericola mali]|uniref:Phenylalanine--tRNA ligase beta subunit n=1 Tax=Rhizosphaericola mali TaxID=2545455 RepID=A0A5P2G3H1_9BACT|nr:phenylalanine--tRNA ligase subunit beta [Rhizosphaericola mali]QES90366.1 phenylalanine--tRNA ligase subunit beta [Rhizosphaericola mali]
MTISYSWLNDYLPEKIEEEQLSKILTSIGLEVEAMESFESLKGGLEGLVVGEVLTCVDHENSDHLHVTTVNIGKEEPVQVVCGATNVAAGQKIILATVGATIYPLEGDPLTMKKAKIRGVESFGMICAQDEIGLGNNHDGIMVLPNDVKPGTPASEYFNIFTDTIYEIGLTANRMDAMSHIGVARDVCAYLSHHQGKEIHCITPSIADFKTGENTLPVKVTIENTEDCQRYAGISLSNITVKESPEWLQNRLKAVGIRPINNVVDITNFILEEYGQPLHSFDLDKIEGHEIIVKNLPEGTKFITLDEKERTLKAHDLMICDQKGGLCIAGVFGGLHSGITDGTKNVFLESAFFKPTTIRKTSVEHNLRTAAATHFEKGVDISNTVNVLKRAVLLLQELAGAVVSSDIVDIYPNPKEKQQVTLEYNYLKVLSGKYYAPQMVTRILNVLGFDILSETEEAVTMTVPFNKPDISLPADIVEEIIRIDGLDNIGIPASIHITPSVDLLVGKLDIQEKVANYLSGEGFNEILTNSITNSQYYNDETLEHSVKMLNSLSADLDVMRPSMLETGLEVIAYNSKRKMSNLRLFELGKSYYKKEVGNYIETEHIAIYISGKTQEDDWISKGQAMDFFYAKGIVNAIATLNGIQKISYKRLENDYGLSFEMNKKKVGTITRVSSKKLKDFDIKAPVYFIDILLEPLVQIVESQKITYTEIPKFPSVSRDLAMVLDSSVSFDAIESVIKKSNLNKLENIRLFDIFENEKIGKDKKSIAINFSFQDQEKTLTDAEIDKMIQHLIKGFEKELGAEIRK